MTWWKKVWKTGWKVALAGVATIVLLESLLTFFPDVFFPERFYVYDSDMGFRVRSYGSYGLERANEFGFNDRDYPHEAAPGVFRILVLSDSFNWAGGPLGNYTSLLEERFAGAFGQGRVEVITAGYSMTHTVEQWELLKKFGLRYNPDLVVLGFFAGNDFFDAHPHRRRIGFGGTFVDYNTEKDWFFEVFGQPVIFRSRLLAFLEEKRVLWRTQQRIEEERQAAQKAGTEEQGQSSAGEGEAAAASESQRDTSEAEAQPEQQADEGAQADEVVGLEPSAQAEVKDRKNLEASSAKPVPKAPTGERWPVPEKRPPPTMSRGEYVMLVRAQAEFALSETASKFDPHLDYIFGALTEMDQVLEERGIPLVVAAYPAEWQVDDGLKKEMLEEYGLSDDQFEWTRAQRILSEFCREREIEFHDLTPAFREEHSNGWTLYLPNDPHWNPNGNHLAARELFEILTPKVMQHLSDAGLLESARQPAQEPDD